MKIRPNKIPKFDGPEMSREEFEKFKHTYPKEWKKMKERFDIGRQIAQCQYYNGTDNLNESVLRMYLHDFNRRYLKYGPGAFPLAFNLLEAFLNFNTKNSILELVTEEEVYKVSLEGFLEHITNSDFDLSKVDFFENIPEGVIYYFSFSPGFDEYTFRTEKGKEFVVGHISMIRRSNEVVVLLNCSLPPFVAFPKNRTT